MSALEGSALVGLTAFALIAAAALIVWLVRDMADLREFRRSMGTLREQESDGRSDESLTVARNPLHSNGNRTRATAREVEVRP